MGFREGVLGFVAGIVLIALAVGVMELVLRRGERRVRQLREQGLLPAEGAATMADVDAQLARGERGLAVTLYVEIHGVSILRARSEVARLAASLRTNRT